MAYYCYVLDVEAPDSAPNHFTVPFELREEGTDRVLMTSSIGITVPTTGTVAERRQAVVNQVTGYFDDLIARVGSRDAVLTALQGLLVGQRWPQA